MDYREFKNAYGKKWADERFGISSHLVFVVKPGKNVVGKCGKWIGSQPLATGQTVEQAKQKLRNAIDNAHTTEEVLT